MLKRALIVVLLLAAALYAVLFIAGSGLLSDSPNAGTIEARAIDPSVVAERAERVRKAGVAIGVAQPKQILFGDLHVHSTFSFDAFQMSLPMAQGEGAHPVADACDFARHCAALDFWSINDHGIALTPDRWAQTVDSIRQCNEVSGDPQNPDTVAYLGWEWTQVGWVPEEHYGHKNVIVRDLDDDSIPARPITAGLPPGTPTAQEVLPATALVGAMAVSEWNSGGPELARYVSELAENVPCEDGVPVRDLPLDCQENATTPKILFDKLDDWGHETLVIPHGTAWGLYTPLGSSWDKQLEPGMHDPDRQRLIEVFSGHGNSEEFRPYREVIFDDDGSKSCPPPNKNYLPSCWRAGPPAGARARSSSHAAGARAPTQTSARSELQRHDSTTSTPIAMAAATSCRVRCSPIGRIRANAATVSSHLSTTAREAPPNTSSHSGEPAATRAAAVSVSASSPPATTTRRDRAPATRRSAAANSPRHASPSS